MSYADHMNNDAPKVDSFSHKCYQALSSPCQFLRTEPGNKARTSLSKQCRTALCLASSVRLHQITAVLVGTHRSCRTGRHETNYTTHVSSTAEIKSGWLLNIVCCQAIWSTVPRVWICNIDLTYTSSIGVRTRKSLRMLNTLLWTWTLNFLKKFQLLQIGRWSHCFSFLKNCKHRKIGRESNSRPRTYLSLHSMYIIDGQIQHALLSNLWI